MRKHSIFIAIFGLIFAAPIAVDSQTKNNATPLQAVQESRTAGSRQSFAFKSKQNPEITVFYALPPKITRQTG